MSDESKEYFDGSHLNLRVSIPGCDVSDLLAVYLLAIPLFNTAQSGASIFCLLSKDLKTMCMAWRVKVIGSPTDGAPNMTGCNVGFTMQLVNFYIVSTL